MTQAPVPVIVYDGDCGFCTSSIRWARARIRALPAARPFQSFDVATVGLTRQDCERAVAFVDAQGSIHWGSRAVARILVGSGGAWSLLGRVMSVPGIRGLSAVTYRTIANNRHRLPGSTSSCDTGQ
jgi:predicted DCC family thiol-disulfide oxidoreductase YuxK